MLLDLVELQQVQLLQEDKIQVHLMLTQKFGMGHLGLKQQI